MNRYSTTFMAKCPNNDKIIRYALSREDAELRLAAIHATATINGQVIEFIEGGEDTRPNITIN